MKNLMKAYMEIIVDKENKKGKIDKKIILPMVIIVVFSLSLGGSFAKEPLFFDVPANHWAYESIARMHRQGIIAGYTDGSFKPVKKVTYGEFVKMLAVITEVARPIEDSHDKHWALPFYTACLNNFHFTEWDISERQFDIEIPRKDMALVVSGAMGSGVRIADYGDYGKLMEGIYDIDERHSHEFHIIKAYATGVLTGYPDGSFRPDEVLTRAEAASVIERLGKLLKGTKDLEVTEATGEEGEEKDLATGDGSESDGGEEKTLVEKRQGLIEYPEGSVVYIIFNYHDKTREKHKELGRMLDKDYPEYGLAMINSFDTFMAKPISMGGFGLRKEYFGQFPVFMEHMSNSAAFTVFPIGYDDPYWGIKPGQVDEYIQ